MSPSSPQAGDDVASYSRRLKREAADNCRLLGSWSVRWAKAVIAWGVHIVRNTAKACWSNSLLSYLPLSELSNRRTLQYGRPLTRASPGFICRRWTESVREAARYLDEQSVSLHSIFDGTFLEEGSPRDVESL